MEMNTLTKVVVVILVMCMLLACEAISAVPAGEDPLTGEVLDAIPQSREAPGDDLWDRLIRVEESVWE